ncbi:unnamed protein product [Brassica oleracea var. botrytis]|uniref:BnaC06g31210D protein n=2 Tax=Brassica napus TaxID=3708 RepID=A0A078FHR9_BRANA|nr:hypothetical protein HID58_072907 [Brassica napus]CAF2063719.1 unnamed protein product [Brassica napus]CDY11618.1 BnaC06g31210D [Brassica napus]
MARAQEDSLLYILLCCISFCSVLFFFGILKSREPHVSNIEVASMDFTVNWDLLIRLPDYLLGDNKCPQGDIQASLFYKDLTLATSSTQRYEYLNHKSPQLLRFQLPSLKKISAVWLDKTLSKISKRRVK